MLAPPPSWEKGVGCVTRQFFLCFIQITWEKRLCITERYHIILCTIAHDTVHITQCILYHAYNIMHITKYTFHSMHIIPCISYHAYHSLQIIHVYYSMHIITCILSQFLLVYCICDTRSSTFTEADNVISWAGFFRGRRDSP